MDSHVLIKHIILSYLVFCHFFSLSNVERFVTETLGVSYSLLGVRSSDLALRCET